MRLRWGQLARSVTARFVIVAFLVQLSVTGGILLFVQQSSESALAAEQKALVTDLREDLVSAWRAGGDAGDAGDDVGGHVRLLDASGRDGESCARCSRGGAGDGGGGLISLRRWGAWICTGENSTTGILCRRTAQNSSENFNYDNCD